MSLPTPNTRKEQYLNAIATGNAGGLPTPITREEEYLDAIAKGGGSGDGDMKKSVYDSDLDVAGAGGIKAFVNSAVAGKVDKVEGKGLSTNDYTDEDKAIVDGVTDALAEKADTDDIPDLVSDNLAKGILGNETVLSTDTVPFVSKIMGAGKYQRKKFVGCSFVWNQLAKYENAPSARDGFTFTVDGSSVTIDGTSTITSGNTEVSGWFNLAVSGAFSNDRLNHVIIINSAEISGTSSKTCYFYGSNINIPNPTAIGGSAIGKIGGTDRRCILRIPSGTVCDNYKIVLTCIDLTQLFGSTAIADYIYNLEQATAGAGIAKLKELGFFTEDYYAYDAGSVQSVDIKEYSVLGGGTNLFGGKALIKNALSVHDENVTVNETNDTVILRATLMSGGKTIATFDKWALPNTQYTFMLTYSNHVNETNMDLVYTDGTSKSVPRVSASEYESGKHVTTVFTSDENKTISYLRGIWNNGISTLYADESGVFARGTTEFEPYHFSNYPLTPTELRGVPQIDTNNNIYADGDEYASDGGHTEKYDICDLGELNWGVDTTTSGGVTIHAFYASLSTAKRIGNNTIATMICSKYLPDTQANIDYGVNDKRIGGADGNGRIWIYDSIYNDTDPADFKTAMSGVYLVYEKATPTTETLTSFDYPQSVGSLEEIVDYKVEQEQRDVAIPTGHVTEYMGKGGEFTLPTLPETPSVLAYDGHNFFWKPETA